MKIGVRVLISYWIKIKVMVRVSIRFYCREIRVRVSISYCIKIRVSIRFYYREIRVRV